MQPARKSRLFSLLFSWHVRRRMRRHFSAIYVAGLDRLREPEPTILFVNHSAWWDSLICFDLLYRTLGRDAYAMMDEASLRKMPFLAWIGGFGVCIGDRADGQRAITYAASLLKAPRVVVMFPQGREQPVSLRPLGFKPGLARLAAAAPHARALPMALRYEHGRSERPFLLVHIGAPTLDFERGMLDALQHVEQSLHDGSYRKWHPYLPSRRARWVGQQREP